ncbi:ATP-dependent nuclease [Devosia sp. A16]|uniref:ATP-dependent nuclease n=1 Tax=Devosia sp. A16 TaxID=1736675 RepID=UPI0006D77684|nr:AAA family ATPase [Devosia sp. A16]
MISSVEIRNFRSIGQAAVQGNWITSCVGPNDAGKSNILRALNLFFNGETDRGQDFDFGHDFNQFAKVGSRKAKQIDITITFDLPASYVRDEGQQQVVWSKHWREEGEVTRLETRTFVGGAPFPPRSKVPALMDRIKFTYVPAIKDREFFADLQGRLYDVLSSVAAAPLKDSASAFEGQIQQQLAGLLDSISTAFSTKSSMRLPNNLRQIFENLEINTNGIPLSRRGDGVKIRHIPMLLRFIADKQDQILNRGGVRYTHILGFEEPENNVEMSSAFLMAKDICGLIADSDNFQLFITTHSPVFYRIGEFGGANEDWITTNFVRKEEANTIIDIRSINEVDESMGLMPLVAPFIRQAKERHDEIVAHMQRIRDVAEHRKPTIFVEGETDKRVVSRALALFAANHSAESYHIDDGGPDYGSASALVSRSIAWLLHMRHRPVEKRSRALALFDGDEPGRKAKLAFAEAKDAVGLKSDLPFRALDIRKSQPLVELAQVGIVLPADLESLYSDELWAHAEDKGWLADRDDLAALLTKNLLSKAVVEGLKIEQALSSVARLRFRKAFTDTGKVGMSKHIARLSDPVAREQLAAFAPLCAQMTEHLFTGG